MLRASFVAGLLTVFAATAGAQSNSLFGSRGALSNTSSALSSSTTGFGSTSGSSALGGGAGGLGSTTSGFGQSNITTELGQLSGTIGQGFIGRSDNAGRLVGQQNSGTGGAAGLTTGGLTGRGGVTGRGTTGTTRRNTTGTQPNQQNTGGGNGQQRTVRVAVRVAFTVPVRNNGALAARNVARVAAQRSQLSGVQARAGTGGSVMLQGTVATEHARKLAAALARLEPGVSRVDNQLRVVAQ